MKLTVNKAKRRDIGRNIVRIDPKDMESLDMQTGDVIRIVGEKESAGIAWPSFPQDNGLNFVRMDSRLRKNTGTIIGDTIKIFKTDVDVTKSIVLATTESKIRSNPRFESFVKRKLKNFPVTLGDIILVSIGIKREIIFEVINLKPNSICIIKKETELIIGEKSDYIYEEDETYVTYDDVGGLNEEILKLREIIELPIEKPSVIKHLGIDPPRGVLLTGPSGCGKTLLVKAVANEIDTHYIGINGPEIMNKLYGESEKYLRKMFRKAKEKRPSIIFIDKIDTVASKIRDLKGEVERRVVSELLVLMDGLHEVSNVVVIGETNRLEDIEESLLIPGRFEEILEIGPPDTNQRYEILLIHTRELPHKDLDLKQIAEKTEGYVGADLKSLCSKAAMIALKKNLSNGENIVDTTDLGMMEQVEVEQEDFNIALKEFIPFSKKIEREPDDNI